jgi:hypothetical protein
MTDSLTPIGVRKNPSTRPRARARRSIYLPVRSFEKGERSPFLFLWTGGVHRTLVSASVEAGGELFSYHGN